MKLYSYWRSSASYRVRIALNIKGMEYDNIPIHLIANGGEHLTATYTAINRQKLLPSLAIDEGQIITQSLAIMEYLEEICPTPALLPACPHERAYVRSLAQITACEIHPVNNLRVMQYLSTNLNIAQDEKGAWSRHWINLGFSAIEATLSESVYTGKYCFGDEPGIADCCLIPQVYNAMRHDMTLDQYPTIARINATCLKLPAFDRARPENQKDAV